MKCCRMWHFISGLHCYLLRAKLIFRDRDSFFFGGGGGGRGIITLIDTMGCHEIAVSNLVEMSIGLKKVNRALWV